MNKRQRPITSVKPTLSEDHINNLEASLSVVQEAVELTAKESKVYKDEALARMDTLESEIYTTKKTVSNQVTKSNGNSCAISNIKKELVRLGIICLDFEKLRGKCEAVSKSVSSIESKITKLSEVQDVIATNSSGFNVEMAESQEGRLAACETAIGELHKLLRELQSSHSDTEDSAITARSDETSGPPLRSLADELYAAQASAIGTKIFSFDAIQVLRRAYSGLKLQPGALGMIFDLKMSERLDQAKLRDVNANIIKLKARVSREYSKRIGALSVTVEHAALFGVLVVLLVLILCPDIRITIHANHKYPNTVSGSARPLWEASGDL